MPVPKLLIFDLDDTIFETKSISPIALKPLFDSFKNEAFRFYSSREIKLIEDDLWKLPFDMVADKYAFPVGLLSSFTQSVNTTNFQFEIQCFDDFNLVNVLSIEKVLVTTGFSRIQQAKIDALRLKPIFNELIIDDILDPCRIYKKGIFAKLLQEKSLSPDEVIVIGDNPASELTAGIELGIKTVHVIKLGQERMTTADAVIEHYDQFLSFVNSM